MTTDVNGTIERWSGYATALFGWRSDDVIGRSITDVLAKPINRRTASKNIAHIADGGHWFGSFDCLRHDGSTIPIKVLNIPMVDEQGTIVGIAGFAREQTGTFDHLLENLDDLRALTDRLDEVRQVEERRIAAELHDNLSQPIAMAATEALALAGTPGLPPETAERLRGLGASMQRSLEMLQGICGSLHPVSIDDHGLSAAIERLVDAYSRRTEIDFTCVLDPIIDLLDPAVAEVTMQLVAELLANVERHSRATSCAIEIIVDGDRTTLTVRDDGIGMLGPEGFGFQLMRERCRRVGATLSRTDNPDIGALVIAQLPPPRRSR